MDTRKNIQAGPPSGLKPIIVTDEANAAASFYKRAFNAVEFARIPAPDGKRFLHIRMQVCKTIFVLMDKFPELSGKDSGFRSPHFLFGTSVSLHLQVDDAYQLWEQAINAGAEALVPMKKQFWGEDYGRLKDPFGHEWTIAQTIKHLTDEELKEAAKEIF